MLKRVYDRVDKDIKTEYYPSVEYRVVATRNGDSQPIWCKTEDKSHGNQKQVFGDLHLLHAKELFSVSTFVRLLQLGVEMHLHE